jgi:hypothetical protein
MSEPERIESYDREPLSPRSAVAHAHARALSSPLPLGGLRRPIAAPAPAPAPAPEPPQARVAAPAPPGPGRALPSPHHGEENSNVQRTVNAFRAILPLVQRLLPLIDGNIGTAISNLVTNRTQAIQPAPRIDLAPIEAKLAELQTQRQTLRDQVSEQTASIKRVEDQLEMVRQATDRNTLEQQELLEDLKTFSNKVKLVSFIGIGILVVGFALNLVLYLHIQRVLP